jgi:hypothetical protein
VTNEKETRKAAVSKKGEDAVVEQRKHVVVVERRKHNLNSESEKNHKTPKKTDKSVCKKQLKLATKINTIAGGKRKANEDIVKTQPKHQMISKKVCATCQDLAQC